MLNLGIPRNRGFLDVCRGKIAKPCLRDYLIADLGHVSGATIHQPRPLKSCALWHRDVQRRSVTNKPPRFEPKGAAKALFGYLGGLLSL